MIDSAKIADAEQLAEIATLQRDLAIAQNQLQNLSNKCTRLQDDNDDLSQRLLKRAKRDGESTMLMDRLSNLRTEFREMERARDLATNDVAGLRAMTQQYADQIATIDNGIDQNEFESLKKELEMARDQSKKDLKDLKDFQYQLDEQTVKAQTKGVDSDNVVEIEMLRQEHETITQSLTDRQSELHKSQQTCQLLEDELEDAHAEIDELRRQLEQQVAEQQAVEANKESAEVVAEIMAENIGKEDDFRQSVPVLDIKTAGASTSKNKLGSLLVGVLVTLGVVEGISFGAGKGEVFQYIFQADTVSVEKKSKIDMVKPKPVPEQSTESALSGQIIRN